MNKKSSIILTGNLIQNETTTITFNCTKAYENGADIKITIKALQFEISVENLFFGYNLEVFLKQANAILLGENKSAVLINYNQSSILEILMFQDKTFMSIQFGSLLPQIEDAEITATLRDATRFKPIMSGTQFSILFIPLQNPLVEFTDWVNNVIQNENISTVNPYPS